MCTNKFCLKPSKLNSPDIGDDDDDVEFSILRRTEISKLDHQFHHSYMPMANLKKYPKNQSYVSSYKIMRNE
jgi:hypothetical protein